MTLSALELLRGRTLARQGGRLLARPAPSPEDARALAPLKGPLLALLGEEGATLQGDDLLGNLHLLAGVLAAREGVPKLTWATFYYGDRAEPERVLAPAENLLAHLRWRTRNLPAPYRVHLAATDSTLTLDLQEPVQSLLRVEVDEDRGRVELYLWPEWRMKEYLWAAKEGRAYPKGATLEWKGAVHQGTWAELAGVVGPLKKVRVVI